VGGRIAVSLTSIQWKLSFIPRLHILPDFLQFWQCGNPSSHFKCRSLHVKHPVLTLLGFLAPACELSPTATAGLGESITVMCICVGAVGAGPISVRMYEDCGLPGERRFASLAPQQAVWVLRFDRRGCRSRGIERDSWFQQLTARKCWSAGSEFTVFEVICGQKLSRSANDVALRLIVACAPACEKGRDMPKTVFFFLFRKRAVC
jgi:hypothetical protein